MINNQVRGKRQQGGAIRERYQTQLKRFIEGEFTYSSHVLLKRICQNGQNEPYLYGVEVYKIMVEIVKIMMMNELEILFLGSTLQEMKWKITDPCLNEYLDEVKDVTPKLSKDLESKKVQLSLLLIAYVVKNYLNDSQDNSIIDYKIRETIPNFEKMYQVWVQKVQNNFKFNPKNMNKLFRQMDNTKKEKQQQITDYNRLVSDFFRQNESNQEKILPEVEQINDNFDYRLPIYDERPDYQAIYQNDSIRDEASLNRQVSGIFQRRSSNNSFMPPQDNRRFQMIRNSSLDDVRQ